MNDNTNELRLGSMTLTVEEIGPHNAPEFLQHNGCNRPYRVKTGEQYSRDQIAGAWREKPIPICVNDKGELINGQHTLNSLILSGKTYLFLVARNVPSDVAAVLDRGLNRSLSDVAHFFGANIPSRVFAIARGLEFGISDTKKRSFDEQMAAIQKHAEAIDWIVKGRKLGAWIKPTTLVAVGRAWYTQDRERLDEFLKVMETGLSNGPEDSGAIALRELTRNPAKWVKKSKLATYQKTESAIMAFLERSAVKQLRAFSRELFPLLNETAGNENNLDSAENGPVAENENNLDSSGNRPDQPSL